MISDSVKIAKENAKAKAYECIRDVLLNPAVGVIAGVVLVEYLQGHEEAGKGRVAGGGFMGSVAGTALETGLIAYLLAPSVRETAKTITPLIESLAPLMLAAGG